MNFSIRQKIAEAVKERFKAILQSNGYETNLGNQVYSWRITDIGDDEIKAGPICIINDASDDVTEMLADRHKHTLSFEVKIGVGVNSTEGDRAAAFRHCVQDVTRAIGSDRYWTVAGTRLAYDTRPQGDVTGIDQTNRAIFVTVIKFQILYRTGSFDPYTTP